MTQEPATVNVHVSAKRGGRSGSPRSTTNGASPAETLRLQFADAWADMSASWGVAPAIGRVHAYLSHRAASLALTDAEAWGIVERVAEPRRVGRRGPAGTAFVAVGDHWQWFTSVIAGRKIREGDPIVAVIEQTTEAAGKAAAADPDDRELVALHGWLTTFAGFVRLFDRAVGLIPKLQPRELERGMRLLGEISDETVLRLVKLLGGLPDDDVLELIEALSRLSPTAARRATKLMSGVIRTVAR
jgi:hypothetical protein